MRIGSLFSGIGGLELGLEWAGVGHTVWQVERDPFCSQVLAHHWPDATRHDDVCTVGAHNLAPVDVICGGFPCQDISYAGNGAGLAGARSGLWYEFARIVGEMGPDFVVVENVSALLTRGIDLVLGTLADLGYDAEWSTLRASDVGAPHRRERVFLIAWRQELDHPHRGRREQHHARERRPAVAGAGHGLVGDAASARCRGREDAGTGACDARADGCGGVEPERAVGGVVHPPRRGRGAGPEQPARRADGGREGLGDAEQPGSQGLGGDGHDGHQPGRVGTFARGSVPTAGVPVGWADAVPVRGADGTVRLIPAEAAQSGPQSPLWPVAYGIPGRVARLRAIGNAVAPQCAYVVGRRLLDIDAALGRERAA